MHPLIWSIKPSRRKGSIIKVQKNSSNWASNLHSKPWRTCGERWRTTSIQEELLSAIWSIDWNHWSLLLSVLMVWIAFSHHFSEANFSKLASEKWCENAYYFRIVRRKRVRWKLSQVCGGIDEFSSTSPRCCSLCRTWSHPLRNDSMRKRRSASNRDITTRTKVRERSCDHIVQLPRWTTVRTFLECSNMKNVLWRTDRRWNHGSQRSSERGSDRC